MPQKSSNTVTVNWYIRYTCRLEKRDIVDLGLVDLVLHSFE